MRRPTSAIYLLPTHTRPDRYRRDSDNSEKFTYSQIGISYFLVVLLVFMRTSTLKYRSSSRGWLNAHMETFVSIHVGYG